MSKNLDQAHGIWVDQWATGSRLEITHLQAGPAHSIKQGIGAEPCFFPRMIIRSCAAQVWLRVCPAHVYAGNQTLRLLVSSYRFFSPARSGSRLRHVISVPVLRSLSGSYRSQGCVRLTGPCTGFRGRVRQLWIPAPCLWPGRYCPALLQ